MDANTSGSVAVTLKSRLRRNRVRIKAPITPRPSPNRTRRIPSFKVMRNMSLRLRAQCDANSQFVDPAAERVGHHAVNSDGGEQQGDAGEYRQNFQREAALGH